MVFDMTLLGIGLALLLAPAFAEWGRIKMKADKSFNWIGTGGVMYLMAAAFSMGIGFDLGANIFGASGWGVVIFSVVGFIAVLIGVVTALMNVFK
ncbi:MAG: hypothetical protein GOV02_02595 [Candidatus Aenigmarchaeota archaeon]|nr:hypothetical protein [Candidatus Aenigmarchaeota archaeon]